MTIQMLAQWGSYERYSQMTLASAEETRLVAAGLAQYVLPAKKPIIGPDSFGMCWVNSPVNLNVASGASEAANIASGRYNNLAETKYAGTEAAGWVRNFFPLSALFSSGTTLDLNVLADLRYLLNYWHARGKKVLLVFDDQPTSAAAMDVTVYRDRLLKLLPRLDNAISLIDGVEPVNEGLGVPYTKLAEIMRITAVLFRAMSPNTTICTPSFQGGEGGAYEPLMAASAAGITVRGSNGAGTRGEMFFDVVAHHPYGPTVTMADAAMISTSAVYERTIATEIAPIFVAIANRRKASDGGAVWWDGRATPEVWASEFNCAPDGGDLTDDKNKFRFQALAPAVKARVLQAGVIGCLAAGCSKVMTYAVDHSSQKGPFAPTALSAGSYGDLRLTTVGGGSAKFFDGDLVRLSDYSAAVQGVIYECTADGVSGTVAGVPSSYNAQEVTFVFRSLLGGWHQEWAAIQASVTNMEVVMVLDGDAAQGLVPQLRPLAGVATLINGRLVDRAG